MDQTSAELLKEMDTASNMVKATLVVWKKLSPRQKVEFFSILKEHNDSITGRG